MHSRYDDMRHIAATAPNTPHHVAHSFAKAKVKRSLGVISCVRSIPPVINKMLVGRDCVERRDDHCTDYSAFSSLKLLDGLIQDIDEWLEHLAPFNEKYRHHRTGETNGDAHLMHHEVIVPITNGALDLGPWQQIYYAEFDGQRRKRLVIKIMGE